jgi:pantoate--beta-alanine ligase
LTPEQRKEAPGLYRALRETADRARESRTSVDQIQADLTGRIHRYAPDGQIEYAAVMDPQTLEVASDADGPLLLALAVRLGKARLIDNLLVD